MIVIRSQKGADCIMEGDSKELYDIFWNTRHFIIPIYQRRYSWKISQCARLFDDIENACLNGRSHFIGCIISISDGARGDYLVIDGQQRITTLSLLLKAAYDMLLDGVLTSKDALLSEDVLEAFLQNRRGGSEQDRIKLRLLNEDNTEYFQLFDSEPRLAEDSPIHSNYRYLVSRLKSTPLGFDELYETIKNLQVVDITLGSNDDPQLIFESLNSTGQALTEGDKIRNFVLMGLSSTKQVDYYANYWSIIEKNSGNTDTSGFVRDYLSLKTQRIPNIKAVYADFRKYWKESGMEPEEILKDLRTYSYAYRKLLDADTGVKAADSSITRLSHLETTVIRPFAIEIINLYEERKIDATELSKVFSIVEDYIFRRLVCALPSNALNKIFSTLANDIRKLDGTYENYAEKLSFVLMRKQGSGRFPGDEEFAQNFGTRNFYGSTVSRVLWYIFACLENNETLETKDVWDHLEKGEYSIEHIMPQTITEEWKTALGDDWNRIHDVWKDRLGNLTVVSSSYNSKYKNSTFIKKRDMEHGFSKSGLRLNLEIARNDKWGEAEIKARSKVLTREALSIWPGLSTEYVEEAEDIPEVTLSDDFDYAGKTLISASFDDKPILGTDWSDFLASVCRMIYEEDPIGIARAANQAEHLGFDSFLALTTAEGFVAISDTVYLNPRTNTNRKIWFLRKLFSYLDIDEDSLVMHVGAGSVVESEGAKRERLWSVIIPYLIRDTAEAGCPSYQNRKPTASYYLDGFIGIRHMHLVSSIGLKSRNIWAYLYIDGKSLELNTEIYNVFYVHRKEIEEKLGREIKWDAPSSKARRGEIVLEEQVPFISDESRWEEVGEITGNLMKSLVAALLPYFDDVREIVRIGRES